jgi:hypothetical protein
MRNLMSLGSVLALLSLCLTGTSALAVDDKQDKNDVTGTWAVEIEISGQQGTPEFTLKQEGEKLTGKYKGQFGEAKVTGKVKGKEIEITFEAEGVGKVVYTGTIDKDTMKGKADYGGQATGTWTAKKKAKASS